MVGDASVSVDEAERRLSVWFDAAMDRLSGAYKRNTQRVSLALAVVITVAGNVDSIRLSQMLWTDSGARARVEALARDESKACEVDRDAPACRALLGRLAAGDVIPLGWSRQVVRGLDVKGWVFLFLGLAMTVVAVSRGAPFWFDLLRRLSGGLVSTGPPPAASAPPPPPVPPAVMVKVDEGLLADGGRSPEGARA